MSTATLHSWFSEYGPSPDMIIQFEEVDEGSYGLSSWVGLPSHPIRWSDLPDRWKYRGFDTGYGSAQVPDFTAWDATHVFTRFEYDGSVSLKVLPRNPPEVPLASL